MKKTQSVVCGILFAVLLAVAFALMSLVANNSAEQHLSLFVILIAVFVTFSIVAFIFVERSNPQSKRGIDNNIPPSFLPW